MCAFFKNNLKKMVVIGLSATFCFYAYQAIPDKSRESLVKLDLIIMLSIGLIIGYGIKKYEHEGEHQYTTVLRI